MDLVGVKSDDILFPNNDVNSFEGCRSMEQQISTIKPCHIKHTIHYIDALRVYRQ